MSLEDGMSSRASERQIHVRALRVDVARGPVPGFHTPFHDQQIMTEAQSPAEGRFAEPGLYRYLSIVDLPCFSWLTRMFWRWCVCNNRGWCVVEREWTWMRFFCLFQSPCTYPSRSLSRIWSASAFSLRVQGRLGLGMGLAATQCGKGGLRGWSRRGSSPARQPTTGRRMPGSTAQRHELRSL